MNVNSTDKSLSCALLLLTVHVFTSIPLRAQLTTIWSFTGTNGDGQSPFPQAPLIVDGSGDVYGTAAAGGAGNSGVVFELVPPAHGGNWAEKILYRFTGGNDGRQPSTGVVFGQDGALYGTTYNGGGTVQQCGGGCGVVFKLTSSGGGRRAYCMRSRVLMTDPIPDR